MASVKIAIIAVLTCCLLPKPSLGQACKSINNATKNSRIFLVTFDEDLKSSAGRGNMLVALGGCRSPEDHADKMIEHFQMRYGINLTHSRENPYIDYQEDDYLLSQHGSATISQEKVFSEVSKGMARPLNVRIYWSGWYLLTKQEITTSQRTFKAGSLFVYGMYRLPDIMIEDSDACLEYWGRPPSGHLIQTNGVAPLDLILSHPEIGEGSARGMGFLKGDWISKRYSITFPPPRPS